MIIELTDSCSLVFDGSSQYKLVQKTKQKDEESETQNTKLIGYYKTIGDALDNVIKITIDERYNEDVVLTLPEYIKIYKDVRNEIASRVPK